MDTMTKNRQFTLSTNIENGQTEGYRYIVTPNAEKVLQEIVNAYQIGIHSFSIIGTYGTGKSAFLLNLEKDLDHENRDKLLLKNPDVLHEGGFEVLNIIGDSQSLSELLRHKLQGLVSTDSDNPLTLLREYYSRLEKSGKMLFVAIDEFGKVLEHAVKYNPEEELYFFQKFTEFVNATSRNIILLCTLHQNYSAYASRLTQTQKNEWNKVKGRFQEIVFAEPIEQLLYLAARHISTEKSWDVRNDSFRHVYQMAKDRKFIKSSFLFDTATSLYPLDAFSAYAITAAIQRYGQNERSLFAFLNTRGNHSVMDFIPRDNYTYNLAEVYDYIVNTFYYYLNDANPDSMGWQSIRASIERVECSEWKDAETMLDAMKIVKAIGMTNLFGNGGFTMTARDMGEYATMAMDVEYPSSIIHELERLKIVRFAEYKGRLILFEGTDVNIEKEIANASMVVARPVNYVDDLRIFFNDRVAPARAYYYHRGTPRYFKYELRSEAEMTVPVGDIDGYIQLVFPSSDRYYTELQNFSRNCQYAIIFAYFTNTSQIVDHLHNLKKYRYILDKVLIDKSDRVAIKEMMQLMEYEKNLLNKSLSESLFSYSGDVVWIYKGEEIKIHSQRDFNRLISYVCNDVYPLTPTMNNELFNKHKLSSSISGAKAKYLQALLENSDKENLGFEDDKFPPEKTIYFSVLKNTGLHENGGFRETPSNKDILTLWDACNEFLSSTTEKPRRLSELVKILSDADKGFKLKDGFLDFWLPTYLFIRRQDYSLYGENGQYIPNFNLELIDLMKKHIGNFKVKAYAVDGVKISIFNQYRKFLNIEEKETISGTSFIDTIKPFLFFYNKQLNDYARHTQRIDHRETIRFREVLAHAKDPEKAFLEDLPQALGYDDERLHNADEVKKYCNIIKQAVGELRNCYSQLIDRIEVHLVECLGLSSFEYKDYVQELQSRLAMVKPHLLSDRQKEFYLHAMAQFDNRMEWYQSVCYSVLGSPLDRMRDDQEMKLLDDLVFLYRECEKTAVVSEGLNYKIDEGEETKAAALEAAINSILSNDDNLNVFTLIRILQKKINNG